MIAKARYSSSCRRPSWCRLSSKKDLPFRLARRLPEKHYAHKNPGYLLAMSRGCECIYETDDDSAPTDDWYERRLETSAHRLQRWNGPMRIIEGDASGEIDGKLATVQPEPESLLSSESVDVRHGLTGADQSSSAQRFL